jgi:hypothetical protein
MKNMARTLWTVIVVLMVLLAAAVVAGYFWVNRYLASDEFRQTVSRAASRALHVKGEFEAFHWSGFSIYSGGFSGWGAPDSPIDTVTLREMHAGLNLTAAFHGVWQIDRLEIGTLHLALKEVPANVRPAPPEPAETAPSFLPSTFRIDTIGIREVELTWPATLAGGGRAAKIAVEMKSSPEGGSWSAEGHGGTFVLARFPAQDIRNFSLRLRPDRLYLTEAALQNAGGGTIHAAGEVGLGDSPDLDLRFEVAGVPVTPLLPEDWRARLFGNIASDFRLTRAAAANAPWKIEGKAHLDDARLEALPLLDQMATLTHTQDYRTLKFQTAEGDFVLGPTRMELDHLAIESDGMVRVEGGIVRTGEALDGTLQLGLPPARVRGLLGADQLFTEPRGLYLWTPVHIGGTMEKPTEDLSPRAAAAVLQGLQKGIETPVNQAVDVLRGLFH